MAPNLAIAAIAADEPRGFARLQTARTGPDCSYTLRGLAPGACRLFALGPEDAGYPFEGRSLGAYKQSAEKLQLAKGAG
jgi:hypothetical protein